MSFDVELHCKSCDSCYAKRQPAPGARTVMQLDWPSFLLNRVVVDIMEPLPRTERGNKYIIVITDYSIEWVEAFAII